MRVETWESNILTSTCCNTDHPESYVQATSDQPCLSCEKPPKEGWIETNTDGWWYWYCQPGCLPDSEPMGPFDSEEEAIKHATED